MGNKRNPHNPQKGRQAYEEENEAPPKPRGVEILGDTLEKGHSVQPLTPYGGTSETREGRLLNIVRGSKTKKSHQTLTEKREGGGQ